MALEETLEAWAITQFARAGAASLKMGQDGKPDRLFLWGNGVHCWIEFKKEKTGRARPAQVVYLKWLRSIGDVAYFCDTKEQVIAVIEQMEARFGPATANRPTARVSTPSGGATEE